MSRTHPIDDTCVLAEWQMHPATGRLVDANQQR